jgi:hypothetical protein
VGLHLKHQEHYHTYWKFPGVVGVPTGMAWKLPHGWKAGPIEWPAPERVMMFQIKAQGYYGEVLLPMKITPPKELEPGTKVTLEGKATWMCCGLDCNPGFADLSVTLPVDDVPAPTNNRWEGLFAKARADKPRSLEGYDVKATRDKSGVTLTLMPLPGTQHEPSPPSARPPVPVRTARGHIVVPDGNRIEIVPQVASPQAVNAKGGPAQNPPPELAQDIQMRMEALKEPAIFFTEDGYINPDDRQFFSKVGSGFKMDFYISTYFTDPPPDELRGVLRLQDGSFGSGVIVRVPFTKEESKPPPPKKLPPELLLR